MYNKLLQSVYATFKSYMYFFLPGWCFQQTRNKMFMMFQEGRKHFRPRVDIEIYLCISVQLGSLKFFFDLNLSIQDEGEVPKKPTEHRSSDEVLGK